MAFHHTMLTATYLPLRIVKFVGRFLGLSSPNCLRILTYHDIPSNEQKRFAEHLRWLARRWTFVDPERFAAMVLGEAPVRGKNLLLTFDDGLASNRVIAEQVLNPLGIRAIFFVVPTLVSIDNRSGARSFIAERTCLTHAENVPTDWYNMGWSDVRGLMKDGHTIGCHTLTHARLSQISTESELEREIVVSADILEQHLGVPIRHFSYPFGDLASFSEAAFAVARRRFCFIHTGLRGDNVGDVSPLALRRDAAAFQDSCLNYKMFSNHLLGAFLEGAADFKYLHSLRQYDYWGQKSCI